MFAISYHCSSIIYEELKDKKNVTCIANVKGAGHTLAAVRKMDAVAFFVSKCVEKGLKYYL